MLFLTVVLNNHNHMVRQEITW